MLNNRKLLLLALSLTIVNLVYIKVESYPNKLNAVVGVLREGKIEPALVFYPGKNVYIYWSYRPSLKNTGSYYFYNFSLAIKILDSLNYTLYSLMKTYSNKTKFASISLEYYLSLPVKEYYLNGIYEVKIVIKDFIENKKYSENLYFVVVSATPKILHIKLKQKACIKNISFKPTEISKLYLAIISNSTFQIVRRPVFSIKPKRVLEDSYGNKYALFENLHIPPRKELQIIVEYDVTLRARHIDLNKSLSELKEVPADVKKYLMPSTHIECNNELIARKAVELSSGKNNLLSVLGSFSKFVKNHIKYKPMEKETSALTAYLSREGDCNEYSMLFTALARAVGIPCRVVSGYAHLTYSTKRLEEEHAWCEVYVPELGWVPLEPQAPDNIGYTYFYANGFYVALVRCQGEETTLANEKMKVSLMTAYYKGGEVSLSQFIEVYLIKPKINKIILDKIICEDNKIIVKGHLLMPVNTTLKIIVLWPSNTTSLAETYVRKGFFEKSILVKERGLIRLCLYAEGTEYLKDSCAVTQVFLEKKKSSIILEYPEEVYAGDEVTISGRLAPPLANQVISITVEGPQTTILDYQVITGPNGAFVFKIKVPYAGKWTLKFTWKGNEYYSSAISSITINVKEFHWKYLNKRTAIALLIVVIFVALVYLLKRER